jgi:hypothetical protein
MDLKGHMFNFFFILMLVKLAWKDDSYFLKLSVEWSMDNHTNNSQKSLIYQLLLLITGIPITNWLN